MKTYSESIPSTQNTLLTASIVLAQIKFPDLMDYALKAAIGGAIWLGYKIIADTIDRVKKNKDLTKSNESKE